MGQFEVLGWLVKQRKLDDKKEFTSEEIYKGMIKEGLDYNMSSVRRCLFPLCNLRYVDTRLIRTSPKSFGTVRKYQASKKAIEEKL